MDEQPSVDCQFVGMDLHRRRSVLVRMNQDGERLETVRIVNDVDRLAAVIARPGESIEVVLEATYGWYWAADALAELGATVHLAHPLGVKAFSYRRVKNDERDAADLADLLRMHRLPESWIAPSATRDLRELVRHRAKLVHLRTSVRQQIHALLAARGIAIPVSDLFGVAGNQLLDRVLPSPAARTRVISLRTLLDTLDGEIDAFTKLTAKRLRGDPPVPSGADHPWDRPGPRCGVPRRDRRRHSLSRAGSVGQLGRADPEASRVRYHSASRPDHHTRQRAGPVGGDRGRACAGKNSRTGRRRDQIGQRRGRNIGVTAAARDLLGLVYYALRDGNVRCLAQTP